MTHIYSSTDHNACANDCQVTVERTQQDYHTALFIGEGKRLCTVPSFCTGVGAACGGVGRGRVGGEGEGWGWREGRLVTEGMGSPSPQLSI